MQEIMNAVQTEPSIALVEGRESTGAYLTLNVFSAWLRSVLADYAGQNNKLD